MDVTLFLHDSKMSEEDLSELTLALRQDIARETDLTARQPEERGGTGTRGDAITIGAILLTALSSGTVVALLQVFKAYLERKPTLRFEIEAADGRKLKLEAEHLSPEQIAQTMQAVKQLCKD
ncbi:MAG: effector-associated constant component EACC1 [Candidatus Electronema sp. V4]|uniref:effector-associated constant component EACC1 n=1 Tax=Candidatus Electronema sp. V4 TaxID=3454756 RepID=UPI00405542CE